MLKGEGVWNMTAMFLYMWGIVTRTDTSLDFGNYVPHRVAPKRFSEKRLCPAILRFPPGTEEIVGRERLS